MVDRLLSITDDRKRDAMIAAGSPAPKVGHRNVTPDGHAVHSERLIKTTDATSLKALLEEHGSLEDLGEALLSADPEIDLEQVGRKVEGASRVYLGQDGNILYAARSLLVTLDAQGEEQDRQEFVDVEATVGEEIESLRWSGRLMELNKVVRNFAFVRKVQLKHVNGLTFDFLFEMAKTLHDAGVHVLATGPKTIRAVTSLAVSDDDIAKALDIIKGVLSESTAAAS